MTSSDLLIRAARDGDAGGLIDLIGACFAEYENCILDVDGELPELRGIATWAAAKRGHFWVAERQGIVVGCGGYTTAAAAGGLELRKLYVAAAARRRGLGAHLCARVEEAARQCRAEYIDLWSDTRFLDAHRLYERLGYARTGETRELHDKSDTVELRFKKELKG